MRVLARSAGASLSSTNYHFGTKEALLEEVLRRRAMPLNSLRLIRLEEAQSLAEAEGTPVPVEALLEAYVRPLFEVRASNHQLTPRPGWVATRLFFDPAPIVSTIRTELFREVDARFLEALERTFPDRTRREVEIAYDLTTGLLVHFAAGHLKRPKPEEAELGMMPPIDEDGEAILNGLLTYAGSGLRSLAPPAPNGAPK